MLRRVASFKPVTAAEEEGYDVQDTDGIQDALDSVEDTLDDVQDAVEDSYDGPHDTVMDVQNNISNHYIAECDKCHEVFVSAVVESESPIDSIEGECPCCHEHTVQKLKWVVRDASDSEGK